MGSKTVRRNAVSAAILLAGVIALSGCVRGIPITGSGPGGPKGWSSVPKPRADIYAPRPAGPARPMVIARSIMAPNEQIKGEYGYHGHLLFPSRRPDNVEQRRAAAFSYFCYFSKMEDIRKQANDAPDTVAVFMAHVRSKEAKSSLRAEFNVDTFLKEYDYDFAKSYALGKGLDTKGIWLVATPTSQKAGADNRLLQLDLSRKLPEQIKAAMLAIDDQFTKATWESQQANDRSLATIMRRMFDSLGRMLTTAVPPAETAPRPTCI